MTTSRTTIQGKDQQVLEGINKSLTIPTLLLGSTSYTPATLAAFIQHRIDLANAVGTTKATWLATVREYAKVSKQAAIVLADLRNALIGAYGADTPKLADFGFSPPRSVTLTPEQKAATVAKRNATRKARKTAGKRQKAKIKGEPVTAQPVVVTEAT
jgi:hypothetical protein